MRIRGLEMLVFRKIFHTNLMDGPLRYNKSFLEKTQKANGFNKIGKIEVESEI